VVATVVMLAATPVARAAFDGTAAEDWPRAGGDPQLTSDVPLATAEELGFTVLNAGALQLNWRTSLDGGLVASPLYLDGLGDLGPAVYVATEAGSVYALDPITGKVVWRTTFATYETPDCGVYGISSTGVIDRARGRLYVAAADGKVHALSLATGAEVSGWPVELPFDPTTGYVWGGLTLVGSSLYVPVASYCDEPAPATGEFPTGGLSLVDVESARVTGGFAVSPPNTLGGIWAYGGTSVDPLTGDIWTATGNSEPLGAGETQGYAESVVQLSPSLSVVGSNRPDGIPTEALDTDFGSAPTLFQPTGCPPLAAAYNKNGELYVWRRDSVGAGPIWSIQIGPQDLDTPFIGEPSWSPDTQMLYVANARVYDESAPDGISHFDAAVGLAIGPGCTFPDAPTWIADVGQGTKPPALVVGDLVFVPGGNATSFTVLDARTGAVLRLIYLEATQYSPPILAGNKVIVGNSSGTVFAFAPRSAAEVNTARRVCIKHEVAPRRATPFIACAAG
jgi:hypothetical protein